MAKCECGRQWLWDWCLDTFKYPNGESIKSFEFGHPDEAGSSMGFEAEVFICKCGKINSVQIHHPDVGGCPVYDETDSNFSVDWEEDKHSYDSMKRE
jgi:hypothetical protein